MATASEPTTDGEGEFDRTPRIKDPNQYFELRRLRQIASAKERVPEVIRVGRRNLVDDEREDGITPQRYREIVAEAVIEFAVELEPIMLHDECDGGEATWTDAVATDPQGEPISLERIVEEDGQVVDENGDAVPLPISVSRAAYRHCSRFLSGVGFGVSFDGGLDIERGFDSTGGA
jgi:hypothetical protein